MFDLRNHPIGRNEKTCGDSIMVNKPEKKIKVVFPSLVR